MRVPIHVTRPPVFEGLPQRRPAAPAASAPDSVRFGGGLRPATPAQEALLKELARLRVDLSNVDPVLEELPIQLIELPSSLNAGPLTNWVRIYTRRQGGGDFLNEYDLFQWPSGGAWRFSQQRPVDREQMRRIEALKDTLGASSQLTLIKGMRAVDSLLVAQVTRQGQPEQFHVLEAPGPAVQTADGLFQPGEVLTREALKGKLEQAQVQKEKWDFYDVVKRAAQGDSAFQNLLSEVLPDRPASRLLAQARELLDEVPEGPARDKQLKALTDTVFDEGVVDMAPYYEPVAG